MNRYRAISLFLVSLAAVSGCEKRDGASAPPAGPTLPTAALPTLPTIKLWIGSQEMAAEMALTADQVQTGMMFRTNIADNAGMLFVMPRPWRASFWMKNVSVPLSAAYIDADGVIVEIHPLEPHNTNAVVAASDKIQFVLETPRGWFDRNKVNTGAVIRTEKGSLSETFFGRK